MARVLVLCGGDNQERRVSLDSGDTVARGLIAAGHDVRKLDSANPDRVVEGDVPLLDGEVGELPPEELAEATLDRAGWAKLVEVIAAADVDAVFPILHGSWGEDGHIQALLDLLGIPYLGSGALTSALAMDKMRTRSAALRQGMLIAEGQCICRGDDPAAAWDRIAREIGRPVVVKPNHGGSTVGLTITSEKAEFVRAVGRIRATGDTPLVERYIEGREITVGMLDGEPLPVLEIQPRSGHYDYTSKYTDGFSEYLCPAPIDAEVARRAQELSKRIHDDLECRHLARVDWRLTPADELVFLEVNTIPGMTSHSLVPMAAREAGLDFPALMDRFLELVLRDAAREV